MWVIFSEKKQNSCLKKNTTRIKKKPEKISYDVGRNACKGMKSKTSKKKYVDVYTYAIFFFFIVLVFFSIS